MSHPRGPSRGIDWDAQPLGVVPDRELARTLDVNTSSVRSARIRRGIPRAVRPGFPPGTHGRTPKGDGG